MSEKVIFVPGQGMRASRDYPLTCEGLQDAGFVVDEIIPNWKQGFEDIIEQTSKDLRKKIGEKTLILAHSFGANIALPETIQHPEVGLVIASPSVACAEGYDFKAGSKILEKSFPGQHKAVQKFSLAALTGAIQTPPGRIMVLVGEAEVESFPFMDSLAKLAAQSLGVEVTQVPDAVHFIEDSDQYRRQLLMPQYELAKRDEE